MFLHSLHSALTTYLWPIVPVHFYWLSIAHLYILCQFILPLPSKLILGSSQITFCPDFVICCSSSNYWPSICMYVKKLEGIYEFISSKGGSTSAWWRLQILEREREDTIMPTNTKCYICFCECSKRNLFWPVAKMPPICACSTYTCLHFFLISTASCFTAVRFSTLETPRHLPFGLYYGCLMIKV